MGSSKGLKSTLLPVAEHRQAKVCDSSGLDDCGVAAGSLHKCSSRKERHSKVLRPLVKLKDSLVELLVSSGRSRSRSRSNVAYFSMGVVMVPVDFGGYEAAFYHFAGNNNYEST